MRSHSSCSERGFPRRIPRRDPVFGPAPDPAARATLADGRPGLIAVPAARPVGYSEKVASTSTEKA
jgi:hypothetical protein